VIWQISSLTIADVLHACYCRFSVYNAFLLVPVGMSRALAHKPLGLDDDDEDDVSEIL
jgi:hypothetical protein